MFLVAEKKRKKNILCLQAITINLLTSKAILFFCTVKHLIILHKQMKELCILFTYAIFTNFNRFLYKFCAIKSGFPTQVDFNCMQLQALEFPAIPRYGIPKRNTK